MPKLPTTFQAKVTPKAVLDRKERLAINLIDLDRVDSMIRHMLLGGKLDLSHKNVIQVDKDRFDETGVVFTCDLLTAACVCDTIRTHDKNAGDYPTRVYLFRARAWSKVSGATLLSVVEDGVVILNPEVFPVEVEPIPLVSKEPLTIKW